MNLRRLGRSGLKVSPIALGTMQFGWSADEPTSQAVMDAYVEAGGNLIDTADIYTSWSPNSRAGRSEEIIGRWMKERGNRDDLVVATKVRGDMGGPLRQGLSRRWITRACEDSLRRLGVEHIDLYQVHWVDQETPIEETLSALTDLVASGYVRYIGCSNFPAWRLVESLWTSDRLGLARFDSIQPEYSLAQPTRADFERELSKVCAAYRVGVIPYSPLAGGFLTGKYRRGQPLPESVRARGIENSRYTDQNFDTVEALVSIAERRGSSPARVALAWLLAQPAVTAPIVGANTVDQLRDLMGAADLTLSGEEVSELSRVSDWRRSRTDRED